MKILNSLLLFLCLIGGTARANPRDTLLVSFKSEGFRLNGQVIVPQERKTRMPAIIFLMGSGGNSSHKGNYKDFLTYFLEQPFEEGNVALMYFDKRGVNASDGKWYQTDFRQRALDAKNAADYLKTLEFIDPEKIFLIGHSQGGWIVQISLAEYPNTFAGGISLAGATFGVRTQLTNEFYTELLCSGKLNKEEAEAKARKKANQVLTFTSLLPVKQSWKQLKLIRKFEIKSYLPKIKTPLLLMWAGNDNLVNPQWCSEALLAIFPQGLPFNFQTHISQGANHSFKLAPLCRDANETKKLYSQDSRDLMVNWLRKRF